ncbi:MAG: hypothetical protein RLZZ237_1743, partial [Pseudomonadota bacterium]
MLAKKPLLDSLCGIRLHVLAPGNLSGQGIDTYTPGDNMKYPIKTSLLTALVLAWGTAAADPMFPSDTEGFHGYLRAGAGSTTADGGGPQSCYGLGGN